MNMPKQFWKALALLVIGGIAATFVEGPIRTGADLALAAFSLACWTIGFFICLEARFNGPL
jgi:hypothetical protein